MQAIPRDASVSATTYLIPHLSGRRGIIRLPVLKLQDDQKQVVEVEYALADLWQLQKYQAAFKGDRNDLRSLVSLIDQSLAQNKYGVLDVQDGVVLLQRQVSSSSQGDRCLVEVATRNSSNAHIGQVGRV